MSATSRLLILVTLASLCALAAGCGKQDLYESPGAPYEITARLGLPSTCEAVVAKGDWAYVAGGEAGLVTVDISDPAAPHIVGMLNTAKHAYDVLLTRTFFGYELHDIAYVSDQTEGVLFVDVTDPNQPTWNLGKIETYNATNLFASEPADLEEPYVVLVPDGWHGIVWATAQPGEAPGTITYSGDHPTLGEAYGVIMRDGWGYVADNQMGLVVMDLRVLNETAVNIASWADTPGAARDVALAGDYAFVADGTEGLAVFRINGGETPVLVAQYDLSGYNEDIACRDGLLAIAANAGGVHFLDVVNPEEPVYLGSVSTPYALSVAFADDGTCLVGDQEDGLLVLTGRGAFRDETAPAAVNSLVCTPESPTRLHLSWYATGDDRLWGQAAAVEIRQAAAPITDEATWAAATPAADPPAMAAPGVLMEYSASGLSPGETVHFALRLSDDAGHVSALSNSASATTTSGITLTAASLDIDGGTVHDQFTFSVTCYYGYPLLTHDVMIDGVAHAMTNVAPTGEGDDGRYSLTLALPAGRHGHTFRFTAADVPPAETETIAGPPVGRNVLRIGSPETELGRAADEVRQTVVFGDSLFFETREVTQAMWDAVMPADSNPSVYLGADRPVDSVTWVEAIAYCNARSNAESRMPCYSGSGVNPTWNPEANGWRLPTEAEWEYLCRAGAATAFAGGEITELYCLNDPVLAAAGWYCANAGAGTHSTGGKAANAWGLFDMHGNVREWCWDWYGERDAAAALDPAGPETGIQKICRGGSWYYSSQDCRSAARGKFYPDSRDNTVGLRVVRTVRVD